MGSERVFDGGGFSSSLGKGLHAKDGKAKIRPALEKLCQEYVGILDCHNPHSSPRSILGAALHTIWIPRMLESLLYIVEAKSSCMSCSRVNLGLVMVRCLCAFCSSYVSTRVISYLAANLQGFLWSLVISLRTTENHWVKTQATR